MTFTTWDFVERCVVFGVCIVGGSFGVLMLHRAAIDLKFKILVRRKYEKFLNDRRANG